MSSDDSTMALSEVIARFLDESRRDAAPSREELLRKYPHLAEDLQSFFVDHDQMKQSADDDTEEVTIAPNRARADTTVAHGKSGPVQTAGTTVRYFGDYELMEEVARGGMGVVYKARQSSLNRVVALKMILAGQLATKEDVQRFYSEAEAAANLDHAGIVPIFEVGEQDGQHYFSMGFVDGESLADRIQWGPLPPRTAAILMKKIADAISYAHERGVIHRDLKPANVLLDENDEPRLTDFGLAKRVEHDSGLTATGQIVGTPSYMPPEQASGKLNEITELADVYSLGAVLYALLVGRPPFHAANQMDTLLQVLEREPIAPRALNPHVPLDLDTICLKSLQKDRRHRYQSAQELAEELDRFLGNRPIRARPISTPARAWRWCKRKPVVASLLAAVVLLTVVGTTVSLSFALLASREAEFARQQRHEALLQGAEADRQKREAQRQQRSATARAERIREQLYVSDVFAAGNAWQNNNVQLMERLLRRHLPLTGQHDLRQFEWYYLWRLWEQTQAARRIELPDVLKSIAFSPDGKWLAALLGSDRSVVLVDPNTGEIRERFDERRPSGWGREFVVFSPGGKTLAHQGDFRHVIRLRNLETGGVKDLVGHVGEVRCAAFSPAGDSLVTGGADGTLRLWQTDAAKPSLFRRLFSRQPSSDNRILVQRDALISSCAFSPDGQLIAFGCLGINSLGVSTSANEQAREITIYDLNSGTERSVVQHNGPVGAVAFSADGRRLASSSGNATLKICDLEQDTVTTVSREAITGSQAFQYEDNVKSVLFSRSGNLLAATGKTIEVWNGSDLRHLATFRGHSSTVMGLTLSPDGLLASASLDHSVMLWDLQKVNSNSADVKRFGSKLARVEFCPSGELAVEVYRSGKVHLWDPASGSVRQIERSGPFAVSSTGVIATTLGGNARFVKLDSGEEFGQSQLTTRVGALTYSRSGDRLVYGGFNGAIQLRNPASGELEAETEARFGHISDVAISPDGTKVAAAHNISGKLVLWDLETRHEQILDVGFGCGMLSLDFSPDGRRLAVGSQFLGVTIWDLEDIQRAPVAFPTATMAVKFANARTLFSGGTVDSTVRVWDVELQQLRCVLVGDEHIADMALAEDGTTLATSSWNGTVRLFHAATDEEVRQSWN